MRRDGWEEKDVVGKGRRESSTFSSASSSLSANSFCHATEDRGRTERTRKKVTSLFFLPLSLSPGGPFAEEEFASLVFYSVFLYEAPTSSCLFSPKPSLPSLPV